MPSQDLKKVESHFRFGENWQSFVSTVTEESVREAERGLQKLFPNGELEGRRFLDIGCGSGLSMLAASRLGARSVMGIDIDPESVGAAKALLSSRLPDKSWTVKNSSVFDLHPEADGTYDAVYSWGVLHHTGDTLAALDKSLSMIAPNGRVAIALYRKTPARGFWTAEKKFYTSAPRPVQWVIAFIFKTIYFGGLIVTGRNPVSYIRNYRSARGMDWSHDVHDWLGGYPYESFAPASVVAHLNARGYSIERMFEHSAALHGLLGSHCDEFVAVAGTKA